MLPEHEQRPANRDYAHALAIQQVMAGVQHATGTLVAPSGLGPEEWDGFTHDLASARSRANLLHPAIARTSAVNCVKQYFLEISRPIVEQMLQATDGRKHHQ